MIRANGRPEDVVAFEEAVVAFFLDAAEILGIPKSLAAIYGVCFASPEPLSFSEVQERLDISAGSISQGLRVLRETGALKEVSQPADKAELFEPDLELRKLVSRFLESRVQKQLKAGKARLGELKQLAAHRRLGEAEVLKRRLKSLSDWHAKARALLPVAETFLRLRV